MIAYFIAQVIFTLFFPGSCIKITSMDEVAATLATYNRNLMSLDLWKTSNLTQLGVGALSQCVKLEEVDFGWWYDSYYKLWLAEGR